jgi:nucleoside-diphosphate-sugar epimerase
MSALPKADLAHVLTHTQDIWEGMRGRNLFVTGGTGFFGRWLLESFVFANDVLDLGAHMTVLTRDPAAFARKAPELAASPSIHFIRGDVRELDHTRIVQQLPAGHSGEFPFVIHAAMDSVGQDDPVAVFDTIVGGTRAVLDFALAAGTRRLLFTSSGAVYGAQPSELTHVPETYPGAPDPARAASAYGEGKRAAELLCAAYHARHPALEPVIARCFAFVGPLLPIDAHFAVGNFIRDALRGGPITIGGDGTPYRSYLYAADLAIWLWTMLLRGKPAYPYNVGSREDVTILKLATTVAGCFPKALHVTLARQPQPGVPCSRYVPAIGRAADELGLAVLIPLTEAISRTAAWHSSTNPEYAGALAAG